MRTLGTRRAIARSSARLVIFDSRSPASSSISNWAITGTFAFTPGGVSFVFGRLVDDGIIDRYLHEQCPDPKKDAESKYGLEFSIAHLGTFL